MPTEDLTDLLLERLQAGDRQALRDLFDRYHAGICSVIRRYVHDASLTDDLAQEVFVRFWEKREVIQISSSLWGYLRRMAVNEALSHLRRQKITEDEDSLPILHGGDVEVSYLYTELQDQIAHAVNRLPERCRLIFLLSREEGLTYREIAEQLDISPKTVENQMGKALRVLREQLAPYLKN